MRLMIVECLQYVNAYDGVNPQRKIVFWLYTRTHR